MKWYHVTGIELNGKPFIKKVKAGGKNICLVSVDNRIFALSAKCPHAGADLSEGWCNDGKLVCPFHHYSYDLKTGRGSAGQNDYVETYPVEKRADGLYIGISSLWDKLGL